MLNTLTTTATATGAPALDLYRDPPPAWSVVERDEYGPLTGRTGLFTAGALPIALIERDELGRRLATFAPDGDLV
jgi:hypothetical protein